MLFPALALRADTVAALRNPKDRARKVLAGRPGFLDAVRTYPGRDEAMPGVPFENGQPVVPQTATPAQRTHIDSVLRDSKSPPPAIAQANDAFLGHWLQRIATLAQTQNAPLVVYPLPRGPYRDAFGAEAPLSPALQQLQRDGADVLPADFLAELEAPGYFFDALHANRPGRERTGARVGEHVRAVLAERAR